MRIACWITKATDTHTHTQYAILTAFPQQQWLHERALIVPFMHICCLAAVYSWLAHRVKTEQWPVQVHVACRSCRTTPVVGVPQPVTHIYRMNNVCWSPFSSTSGQWCPETLVMCPSLVFLPPQYAVCGVVTVIWPHGCDSQHHEQSQPLPVVTGTGWRTFWLQQSTVCVCCIPHGCGSERFSSTTHFSIRPVRSPDLLGVPRGNEALPQTVSTAVEGNA
jgi:hypothetical protein